MSINVLIADSSIPFSASLAEALRGKGASVAVLSGAESDNPADIPWNRPSPLSSRTVLLDVKNRFVNLDCAVIGFDPASLPQSLDVTDQTAIVRVADEFIRGNLLLVSALADLFRRQGKGVLCFALMGLADGTSAGRGIPVSVAESAFIRLAEETALTFVSSSVDGVQPLLVRLDPAESAAGLDWLVSRILNPAPARKDARWVKAGARSIFGKL